jgi:hypothetical protein
MKTHLGYFARNIDAGDLLEMFLISAVFSILLIRLYLHLTGYPQVSVGRIHIAHMLWGGFLLMTSTVIAITFLNKEAKRIAAVVGGVGFGTFIDELGKFVTADNDYFFEPAIAIIYIIFVALFFLFRFIEHSVEITKKEYAINALELSKDVLLHDMDEAERKEALHLLTKSNPKDPGVIALKHMLHEITALPTPEPSLYTRLNRSTRDFYQKVIRNQRFTTSVVWFFSFVSVFNVVTAFFDILSENSFITIAHFATSFASFLLVGRGIYMLRRARRLEAYSAFKWALLTSILLTQVFAFYTQQLAAILGLTISIFVLNILQYVIAQEKITRAQHEGEPT